MPEWYAAFRLSSLSVICLRNRTRIRPSRSARTLDGGRALQRQLWRWTSLGGDSNESLGWRNVTPPHSTGS